jgi:hypothetical protein
MSLAFRVAGDAQRGSRADMEIIWADPERHSLAERYDAAVKAQAAGVPWRTVMQDVLQFSPQFSPQQVDRMEAERAADAFLAGVAPDGEGEATDADDLRRRFEALGIGVRAGVDPEDAARRLGLAGIEFTGAVPTSLRLPESDAADLEDSSP